LEIVIERFAKALHQAIQFGFTCVSEGRMAYVVGQGERFREISVKPKRCGDGAGDLRDLNSVRQAIPKVIGDGIGEDLGLVFKAAKGAGVNDAITVALEVVAIGVREFRIAAAAAALDRKFQVGERRLKAVHFFVDSA
jgi:hypothetical protein